MDIKSEYKIEFTNECQNQIHKNYSYIKEKLCNENSALILMKKIEDKVMNLSAMPKMYNEILKNDKLKRTYRRIVIDNYIILYTIDEDKKIVYVSKMYYGKENYLK